MQYKYYFTENITYNNIKVSKPVDNVGLIQLYRPKAKNALNSELFKELNSALCNYEKDDQIGCIVLAGDNNYFAAGADIKEMKDKTFSDVYLGGFINEWEIIRKIR
jgi:enoyl-CoA hydratase/carnithine racemase